MQTTPETESSPDAITYRFPQDADWLVAAMAHNFKTSPTRRVLLPVLQVGTTLFAMYLIFLGITQLYLFGGIAGMVILPFVWLITPLTYLVARNRHQKSPFAREVLTLTLSGSGFSCTSQKQDVSLDWSVFTAAHRFPDGYLLKQGKHLFNWLPDAGLESPATTAEVRTVLSANIQNLVDHR